MYNDEYSQKSAKRWEVGRRSFFMKDKKKILIIAAIVIIVIKQKIIKNMKSEGLSAEQIARYIGTDINEVLPFFENKRETLCLLVNLIVLQKKIPQLFLGEFLIPNSLPQISGAWIEWNDLIEIHQRAVFRQDNVLPADTAHFETLDFFHLYLFDF